MTYIEKLHLDAITQADFDPEDKVPNYVGFAEKSAEITKEIAIEFAEWIIRYLVNSIETENYKNIGPKTSQELYQEFLKTKQ